MTNKIRMTNGKDQGWLKIKRRRVPILDLVILSSFVIRHWSFSSLSSNHEGHLGLTDNIALDTTHPFGFANFPAQLGHFHVDYEHITRPDWFAPLNVLSGHEISDLA